MARNTFELTPVSPFRLDLTVWTLRRRSHNILDRWDGTTYRRVVTLPAGPVEVSVTQSSQSETARLRVALTGQPVTAAVRTDVTAALERLAEAGHINEIRFEGNGASGAVRVEA